MLPIADRFIRLPSWRFCMHTLALYAAMTFAVMAQETATDRRSGRAANETLQDKAASERPASRNGQVLTLPARAGSDDPNSTGRAEAGNPYAQGSIRFIGNATVLIEYAGFRILTDPNFLHKGQHVHLGYGLTAKRLTDPAIPVSGLPPIDLILLSHAHGDHFDQVAQKELDNVLPVVTTPGAAAELASLGFLNTYPLNAWETLDVRKGNVTVRIAAMPARHGPPVVAATLPETMGSMVEFLRPDGAVAYRIYISGDTLMHDAIKEIPERFPHIDLALLHLGGTEILDAVMVTMDARQGVEMLQIVAPEHAIPIHYNDYDVFKSPIEAFQKQVRDAGLESRVTVLRHGQRYAFRESRHRSDGNGRIQE